MVRCWLAVLLLTGCEGILIGGSDGAVPPDVGPAWENPPPPADGPQPPGDGPKKPDLPGPVGPTCVGATPVSQKMVTGTATLSIPAVAAPAKCKGIKDPTFDTLLSRVTEKSDGYGDVGIENEYSKSDPENADGTLLVLRGTEANWQLYSATDFKRLKKLNIAMGSQEAQPRWDPVNPKILYHLSGMKLQSLNVDTNSSTTVHDFSADVPGGDEITMHSEGDASVDRRYWCFHVPGTSQLITYDKTANQVLGKRAASGAIDWLGMSMSGKHCVVGWDGTPTQAFSRDFSKTVTLPAGTGGHADLSLTADNRDVLVYQNVKTDYVAMADLDTGAETNLVKIPFDKSLDIGLHFSGNCAAIPGWHLVSTYGPKNPYPGRSWMDNHLFMIELKANPKIWRVATTYGYTSIDSGGSKHYFAEGFAAINTRGTKIYWGANWGQSDLDRIDTFVAILPDKWTTKVP
jgi:hypothetical protein